MKCRKNYEYNNAKNVIWFGSKGIDELGHGIFEENKKYYFNLTKEQIIVFEPTNKSSWPSDFAPQYDIAYKWQKTPTEYITQTTDIIFIRDKSNDTYYANNETWLRMYDTTNKSNEYWAKSPITIGEYFYTGKDKPESAGPQLLSINQETFYPGYYLYNTFFDLKGSINLEQSIKEKISSLGYTYETYYYTRDLKKYLNSINRTNNYSENQEAVKDSLVQRLSVIKGELWYNPNYGLPLLDKIRNKGIYDSVIASIINGHPDVIAVTKFISTIKNNHIYSLDFGVVTTFASDDVKSSLDISI